MQNLELRSRISSAGVLELSLVESETPVLEPDQVLVRIEGAPINPSDLWLLLGPIDPSTAVTSGSADRPVLTATIPAERVASVAGRFDQSLPTGVEGAGIVVEAGEGARELIGKTVAVAGGGLYARYRVAAARECFVLPDGITPVQGASAYVNPMTVVSMLETMRREGHTAIVHTAAASNLGQMLVRACKQDGVPLVNIVRSPEQATILRELGAQYVLDTGSPAFRDQLVEAIAETTATLGFDAIGGGKMAGTIVEAMEIAAVRRVGGPYNRYGTNIHKQVYIYGRLDVSRTLIDTNVTGFAWGVGGWLLTWVLMKFGPEVVQRLRARVAAELTTTFASNYVATLSLAEVLGADNVRAYGRRTTGAKYLIDPSR